MQDKGALLDRLGAEGEDRLLLAGMLDRAERTRNRGVPAATDFLSPRQQALAEDCLRLAGAQEETYLFTGGYQGAERRLLLFLPDWLAREDASPPIRALRVSFRQEDGLTHRDLLGGLMGMGVVRGKIGDILAGEDSADLMVAEGVADFLVQSWESAGRVKLRVQEIDPAHVHIPAERYQEIRDTVSSLRLDAVAAGGFRMARGKAADLIRAGRVEVNWRECAKPDRLLSPGDTVTARGFGRLQLAEAGGLTRKGRIPIVIRRFL